MVETKTSKDSGSFPTSGPWYLPLGYGQLLQDHSEAFCFGPLAMDDVVKQRKIFSSQSIAMVAYSESNQ